MKIIRRYIFSECWVFFSISLFAFLGILLTLKMLRFAALIVNKGVAFSQIGMVFVSIVPPFLEIAIPMATLLGIMLAFARMSGDSELVVFRASGISLGQLIIPVLMFGLLACGASLFVSSALRPWAFQELSSTLFDIARTKTTSGLNPGIFNKLQQIILYADTIDPDTGNLENVLIDDKRDENDRKIILAKKGQIISNPESRTIALYLRDGTIHEMNKGNYVITNYEKNSLIMDPDELLDTGSQNKGKKPEEMYYPELRSTIEALTGELEAGGKVPENGVGEPLFNVPGSSPVPKKDFEKKLTKLRIEAGRRFSMPIATLILSLIAMPLGVQPPRAQRTWGAGLSAALGLLVFVLYYGLLSVGVALAEGGTLPPVIALWLPNIIAGVLAAYILRNIASERWQSIAHGFGVLLQSGSKLMNRGARPREG